jgi:hypothetical protein
MKHAMLALLVLSLMISSGVKETFFVEDGKICCLIVVSDDADFADLLTATEIAKEVEGLAGNGCPFSLIRFAEEITKEDSAQYNLIMLGETGLEVEGETEEIGEGLYLLEDFFGTGKDVLVVEDPQALIELLQNF